jgi:hypothetical protein
MALHVSLINRLHEKYRTLRNKTESGLHSRYETGNILSVSQVAVPQSGTFRKEKKKTPENIYADAQCINTVRVQPFYELYSTGYQVVISAN